MATRRRILGMFCVSALASAAVAQSVTLKLKFNEGRKDYYEQVDNIEQAMKGGPMGGDGGGVTIKIKQLFGLARKVESASKEKAVVDYTYDRFTMSMDSPMMPPIVYDSDLKKQDADAAMVEDIFAAMIGSTIRVEIDPAGKVLAVEGMKKMAEKVEATAGGNMFWAQMKDDLTDESFGLQMIKARTSLLPDKEVKPGDTWDVKTRDKAARIGTMIREMKCTLKSVEKKDGRTIATVTYEGKVSSEPDDPKPGDAPGMAIKIEEGNAKGTMEFDVDLGDFVNTHSETQMNMAIAMAGGDAANAMKVAVKSEGTTRLISEKERGEQKKAAAAKAEQAEKEKPAKEESKADKP